MGAAMADSFLTCFLDLTELNCSAWPVYRTNQQIDCGLEDECADDRLTLTDPADGQFNLAAGVLQRKEQVFVGPLGKHFAQKAKLVAVLGPERAYLLRVVGLRCCCIGRRCSCIASATSPVAATTWA